jgi:PTS system nitrogen regulatory IIA component
MATDLSSLLDSGVIVASFDATSRKQAIHALAGHLATATGVSHRTIEDAVMERERLGSTGVGEGVAIPHARLEGLEQPVGGFMRLSSGVDFESIDERPCDLIFMLLAPVDAGADHLRALAQVSRVFRQASVRDGLRSAKTDEDVRKVICNATARSPAA